jgi:beta-lactamase regulating signal transducer with metallopeptidase domain
MPPVSEVFRLIGTGVHAANVLLEWLMTYAIHSTILIGGLLLLMSTAFGRRLLAGHGSWIWRFALVGAVITASLQSIRSAAPLAGTLRLDGDTPARTLVRVEVRGEGGSELGPANQGLTWSSAARTVVNSSIDIRPVWPLLVLGTWLVIATGLVSRFFIARARFIRAIGPRWNADHTLAGNALRHLRREGRVNRPAFLTLSDRLTSPVALGDDEICLPARALFELDPIRMESILAHELAHLVRRDPSWLTVARVIEAVFFFQPLNVLVRRRMQEAAEFASDAWASSRIARPLDLAFCLARVAEWTIAAPRLPVPAMAERRGAALVRRVERLTTGRAIPEPMPGRGARLAAVITLLALIMLAPRAAVGADRPADRVFSARLPAPRGVMMLRRTNGGTTAAGAIHPEVQQDVFLVRLQR